MATCRANLPVKSSVYNQTGENFYQQLGAYNHMNTHLRRVLQAKCVVDSKNPRYMQKHDNWNYFRQGKCIHKCQSHENITRSARDSQYMIDILKPSCGVKGSQKSLTSFQPKTHDSKPSRSENHGSKPSVQVVEPKRPTTTEQVSPNYESSFETSTKSPAHSSTSKKPSKARKAKLDNLKYWKFLHEITQEILKTGAHTDQDIKNVVRSHLNLNLSMLNKTKMLRKLKHLKSSLNIIDSEDEESESEESSEKTYSLSEDSEKEIENNDDKTSEKSSKTTENGGKTDSGSEDSEGSQVSEESIEWQSEIESVINDDDSS